MLPVHLITTGPYFPAFVFFVGACIGSFLNVVIYRMPAGESVVHPGSHCTCGRPIPIYLNIPILSWFFLAGKARCCGRPISVRYVMVEALTAACFLGTWFILPHAKTLAGWSLISILIAASFVDLDTMEIPDALSVGGAVLGVIVAFIQPAGLQGRFSMNTGIFFAQQACAGAIIGAGFLFWVATLASVAMKREAVGLGDVKLVGAIGAFCGWQGAVFAVFGGAFVGVVWYTVLMASRLAGNKTATAGGSPGEPISTPEEAPIGFGAEVPFGPMIAIAGGAYFVIGNSHWAYLLPHGIM
jgi:leader peptidase (prepilin peptidase)/N-methyltransferase